MIKGDKEDLAQIVQTHKCPQHPGKALVIVWHQTEGYVIRCGGDHFPEEVTRDQTLTELYKQGEEIPEPIKSKVLRGAADRQARAGLAPAVKELALLPQTDFGSGALLDPYMVRALIVYAQKYGLDAYRGHVALLYGKPYITIDGYLYYGHSKRKPFTVSSRPLKLYERPEYQVNEGDHAWLAEVRFTESGATFPGIGIVTKEEMEAMSTKKPDQLRSPIVAAHPWQMATKRAEWQALRRAFPIGETED